MMSELLSMMGQWAAPSVVVLLDLSPWPCPFRRPPGAPHGQRALARRDRPEGVAGPGGVARRRSMVSRLRPGELSIRHVESFIW